MAGEWEDDLACKSVPYAMIWRSGSSGCNCPQMWHIYSKNNQNKE